MIPLPAIIYYQLTFPLQLLASRLGADGLVALGVPTIREGNLLILPNCTLEVVEACSGVRSLLSLLAAVVGYVYLAEPRHLEARHIDRLDGSNCHREQRTSLGCNRRAEFFTMGLGRFRFGSHSAWFGVFRTCLSFDLIGSSLAPPIHRQADSGFGSLMSLLRIFVAGLVLVGGIFATHGISPSTAPPEHQLLRDFPSKIDAWHSKDLPYEPEIVKEIGVDDYTNREYFGEGTPD